MTPKDELPLVLRTAYLTLHRRSDAVFAEYGITADQFVLLATLARGQAMTQRELAARMPSDPSTVRAMLVLLEKQGLVTREAHPTDARARTVRLTKVGVRTYQQAFDAGQEIRDQMAESLSASESRTLLSLLQRMTESLTESVTNVVKTADEV
ncbi:MAG: MarR family transcriptional regulator [Planctomycetota bacterium]|nr:MAG: MarR family transcriptional regulator [Planctomycetota bacterium]